MQSHSLCTAIHCAQPIVLAGNCLPPIHLTLTHAVLLAGQGRKRVAQGRGIYQATPSSGASEWPRLPPLLLLFRKGAEEGVQRGNNSVGAALRSAPGHNLQQQHKCHAVMIKELLYGTPCNWH